MKINLKETRPSKINVKGTIQLFWIFISMKIKVFDLFGRKIFPGHKPLFGPILGPENNFWPFNDHFFDLFDQKKILGQKPLF